MMFLYFVQWCQKYQPFVLPHSVPLLGQLFFLLTSDFLWFAGLPVFPSMYFFPLPPGAKGLLIAVFARELSSDPIRRQLLNNMDYQPSIAPEPCQHTQQHWHSCGTAVHLDTEKVRLQLLFSAVLGEVIALMHHHTHTHTGTQPQVWHQRPSVDQHRVTSVPQPLSNLWIILIRLTMILCEYIYIYLARAKIKQGA